MQYGSLGSSPSYDFSWILLSLSLKLPGTWTLFFFKWLKQSSLCFSFVVWLTFLFPTPHVKDNSLALSSNLSQLLLTASLNLLLLIDTIFCFPCLCEVRVNWPPSDFVSCTVRSSSLPLASWTLSWSRDSCFSWQTISKCLGLAEMVFTYLGPCLFPWCCGSLQLLLALVGNASFLFL